MKIKQFHERKRSIAKVRNSHFLTTAEKEIAKYMEFVILKGK